MKVRVGFPLGSDGPLGRAAAVAAGHPSYRVEGANGSARVSVVLDLPDDWRLLDVARSVVRRAERSLVAAGYGGEHPYALRATNRLSDVLFIVARNADGEKTLSKG